MMRLVTTAEPKLRRALLRYLAQRVDSSVEDLVGDMPFALGAITRAGCPLGAVLYTNFRGATVEMSVAGEPGWLTRPAVRDMFAYPFETMGVWTVLSLADRGNRESRELMKRLGAQELGVIKTGPDKAGDKVLCTLTRDRCVWLRDGAGLAELRAARGERRATHGVVGHG